MLSALVATASVAFCCCGTQGGTQLVASLTVAYTAARALMLRLHTGSAAAEWILLATATLMSIGVTLNVWEYTSLTGGTLANPVLVNDDSSRYFNIACELYSGTEVSYKYFIPGLPLVTAALWALLGKSIVYPLAMNVMLTLVAVVLSGYLSVLLLAPASPGKHATGLGSSVIAALGMGLTAAVCHFIGQGMVLLKEPMLYVGLTLTAIVMARLYIGRRMTRGAWAVFTAGCIVIASVRSQMFFFIALLLPMMLVRHGITLRRAAVALGMTAIMAVCHIGVSEISHFGFMEQQATAQSSDIMQKEYLNDTRHVGYKQIIGDYYEHSPAVRAAMLPLTAAVQFAVPFPWNYKRDCEFGYSQLWDHIAYPWYAVGGIILFYYTLLWWRRRTRLRIWALWCLLCWLIPAYLYAGSVSRYVMPLVPLAVPLAIHAVDGLVQRRHQRQFRLFGIIYVAGMATMLTACYFIQQN